MFVPTLHYVCTMFAPCLYYVLMKSEWGDRKGGEDGERRREGRGARHKRRRKSENLKVGELSLGRSWSGRSGVSGGKRADRWWWGRNEKLKMKNEKVGEFESWAGLGGRSWGLGEERGRTGGGGLGFCLTVWAGRGSFGL